MLIHSLLDVLSTLHGGIVLNYTNIGLCQFTMVMSSQTVSLMLGPTEFITRCCCSVMICILLRGLNVDCT